MMLLRSIVLLFVAVSTLSACDWIREPTDQSSALSDGRLEAGYIPYPPSLIVDPNTGQFSGISYDVLAAITKDLGVELVTEEEVAWGTMIENLKNGRSEIVATGIWPTPEREVQAAFTLPIFYSPVYAYVRSDDSRFDGDLSAVNSDQVRIATLDGEIAETIANEDFPNARRVSLPQMSQVSELLLNVELGKADITFVEPAIAQGFLASNPGAIKQVKLAKPVRAFPTTFMIPKGDVELLNQLNMSLKRLQGNGSIDQIISQYEKEDGTFLRVTEFDPDSN